MLSAPLPYVLHATFLLSAASASDFPRTGLPEIAMVGRSNVGKSSLINALVKQKIARTSAAPGKTRLANYYHLESRTGNPQPRSPITDHRSPAGLYLVDLPGYGYARGGAASAEDFEALTSDYFAPSHRDQRRLSGVLQLIDSRHPELESDATAHDWLLRVESPVAIVATKIDKLTRAERSRAIATLEDSYDTAVIPTSAHDGTGLDDIWRLIRSWTS
jgi:GTP-binding protein